MLVGAVAAEAPRYQEEHEVLAMMHQVDPEDLEHPTAADCPKWLEELVGLASAATAPKGHHAAAAAVAAASSGGSAGCPAEALEALAAQTKVY